MSAGAEYIVQITGLQKLNISQNPIDKNGAQAISKMSLIEVLWMIDFFASYLSISYLFNIKLILFLEQKYECFSCA